MFQADPATLAPSPAPAEPTAARALIERQLAALSELAEIGMEIARAAGRAATSAAEGAAGDAFRGDPCLAYTRVARAVRMTFALQAQLLKDLAALDTAEGEAAKARADQRRVGVQRMIDTALAETERFDGRSTHGLSMEARERLFDARIDAEVQGLTFAEIVARICGDLGLPPDRTVQIVAAAEGNPTPFPLPSSSDAAEAGDRSLPSGGPFGPTRRTEQARRKRSRSSRAERLGPRVVAPGGALPEDDEEAEDTFLEWPPPA